MRKFDLSVPATFNEYNKYWKLSWLYKAYWAGLPVSKEWFVFDKGMDITHPWESEEIFLCRPDAIKWKWNKLPWGRDLNIIQIPQFLDEIKQYCKHSILLLFKHPSIELDWEYKERYKLRWGVQISINVNHGLYIEYVWPWFDVGDITKGKATPVSMYVPRSDIYNSPNKIYTEAIRNHNFINVNNHWYYNERLQRIDNMVNQYWEEKRLEIESYVNILPPKLDVNQFSSLFRKIIAPLIESGSWIYSNKWELVVMANIYDKNIYVFDMWDKERIYK